MHAIHYLCRPGKQSRHRACLAYPKTCPERDVEYLCGRCAVADFTGSASMRTPIGIYIVQFPREDGWAERRRLESSTSSEQPLQFTDACSRLYLHGEGRADFKGRRCMQGCVLVIGSLSYANSSTSILFHFSAEGLCSIGRLIETEPHPIPPSAAQSLPKWCMRHDGW